MYVLQYNQFPESIMVGEYEIPLPAPPDKNKLINYGLPIEKQVFRRTQYRMPSGEYVDAHRLNWDLWSVLGDKERHYIEDTEWQRRTEGQWYWIKDMPIYVCGFQYFLLNYWHIKKNLLPEFRENNWCASLLLEHLSRRSDCMGLVWLKGRRKTVTTMANCFAYDWVTRYESQDAGIMNKTAPDARKNNLNRISLAMNSMPAFFDPLRRQNWPAKAIEFMPPDEKTTARSLREGMRKTQNYDALYGSIEIGATGTTTFDGSEKAVLLCDEIGKWKDINPVEMWEVHQMVLQDGANKAGFGILFSSVEEISEEQLDNITELWDDAEPGTGHVFMSRNGLARYAEPFHLGYDGKFRGENCLDPWGFSRHDVAIARREALLAPLVKARKSRAISALKRKMPMDVKDMLRPAAERCAFNLPYLTDWYDARRIAILQDPSDGPVRGTFTGHPSSGKVQFIPRPDVDPTDSDHPDAQVYLSRMPTEAERNNVVRNIFGNLSPSNAHLFTIGVDTFDHQIDPKNYSKQLSDGAFAVKRKLWAPDDDALMDPQTGIPSTDPNNPHYLGAGMRSNQIVCRYVYRDADPDSFAEKVFQAAVYFGAVVHIESTKPGRIRAYAKQHGLENFLYFRDNSHEAGWSGHDIVQAAYFDLLSIHVERYVRAERDPEVIRTLMRMERGKMKRHDLGVAIGIAELGSSIYIPPPRATTPDGTKIKLFRPIKYRKMR